MARPQRQFTDEEVARITDMALNNCHFETIAMTLGIAVNTLKRRYGRYIKQKRAEGRTILRQRQVNLSKTQAAMAIFLGKNELNQTDKQEQTLKTDELPEALTPDEVRELRAAMEIVRKQKQIKVHNVQRQGQTTRG